LSSISLDKEITKGKVEFMSDRKFSENTIMQQIIANHE